ncbi:MAG: hypothetical protein IPO04_21425 [Cytophagaceae bacterium]|nr:hypothetical protein [Cytophagaceae bacterium]
MKGYSTFQSDSINRWNTKSKELIEIQEQWNSIKGAMPREKAKMSAKISGIL